MKTTMSQGETVASWSVIGNKVYRDNVLFAKASNWPDAIAIRDALSCHDDLLSACRAALILCNALGREACTITPANPDKSLCVTDLLRNAIIKTTTQKAGAK